MVSVSWNFILKKCNLKSKLGLGIVHVTKVYTFRAFFIQIWLFNEDQTWAIFTDYFLILKNFRTTITPTTTSTSTSEYKFKTENFIKFIFYFWIYFWIIFFKFLISNFYYNNNSNNNNNNNNSSTTLKGWKVTFFIKFKFF